MAANPQQAPLSGLARALVQAGRLKEAEAESLLTQAAASGISFIEQAASSKKMTPLQIATFAAETFGYPLFDLSAFDDAHIPKDAIDRKLIGTHKVIPLHAGPLQLQTRPICAHWTKSASRPASQSTRLLLKSPS
jgi:type IV pilus assembly protein PilB